MKKNLFVFFTAVLLFATFGLNAQNVKVSGNVKDSDGLDAVGAGVLIKGTTMGTVTDLNGNFTIDCKKGETLVISYLGFKDTEVVVDGSAINVTLASDTSLLDEVVVLGYGIATKKQDLSASVGVVASPETLAKHPVSSTTAMLQGQIPGVVVQNNGGDPTSGPSMVIRGQGSQNGDSVLWVVDGVPGAPISSMSDIESIVVLKDAASAAIYGAQSGAGGVVIVTTKKGKKGVSVSYDGLAGVRTATNLIHSCNAEEQARMRVIGSQNSGIGVEAGWDPAVNPWAATTRTDWVEEIFRNAAYHRHNVVLNAGNDSFRNRVSFTAEDNQGVLVGTYAKNMGIQYRGEYQINKWAKISEDLTWKQSDSRGVDTNSGYSGAIISAIYMPQSASRNQAVMNADGTYSYIPGTYGGTTIEDANYAAKYGSNYANLHGDVYNPFRLLESDNRYNRSNSLFTTTSLELGNFERLKGLKFISRFSFYVNNGFSRNFTYQRLEVGKPDASNSLSYSASRGQGWKTENTLTWDRTFGKHTVGALFSTTSNYESGRGFSASASTFADESETLQYFNFASTINKPGDYLSGPDANIALIARLSYSYDDRYFMTASWRRDYAGRLPDGHNFGDFPAVTGGWKISSEKFWNKNDAVTLLKLRGSWGRVGNLGSIGWNYKSNTLNSGGWNESAMYGIPSGGGYVGTFYWNGKALNNELTWETSEQADFGIDAAFLKDRLSASVDVYWKRTFNLIQGQTSGWPNYIGVDAMKVNLGEIRNRGIELSLGWKDKVGEFSYYINGNAGFNKNWVHDIGVTTSDGTKGVWTGGGSYRLIPYIYQTCEGGPLSQYYMINCLGIFQSWEDVYDHQKDGKLIQPSAQPGDLKFEDANGDGKIDSADRVYQGNSTPDWTYSINAGFNWKGLSFGMQLYGVQGAKAAYVGKYSILGDVEGNFNRSNEVLNAWSEDNRHTSIPRLSRTDPNSNFSTPSTWYLEDASFLRIKNVTVGYDLTKVLNKMSHFEQRGSALEVYFSGENLFTFTKYTGMDPECGGYDALKYPVNRVLSLGVKLTY